MKLIWGNEQSHEPEFNLINFPMEVLEIVASFLPQKDLNNFGLVNKKCQKIFQLIDHKVLDLRKCFKLNEKKMLEVVKTRNYIKLNLNYCHWLSSEAVLELVSKESVRELKIIDCNCTPEVIEAITKLNLTSLSVSSTRNWIKFFVADKLNSIPRFGKLKKLKIFTLEYKQSGLVVTHVSQYVLRHCPNLEYLKLFTYPFFIHYKDWLMKIKTCKNFQPQNIPTPVPKLKTLILDLHYETENIFPYVSNLVQLILNKKESPLKQIYLGRSTAKAISSGILSSKNNSFEKTRILCLSSNLALEDDMFELQMPISALVSPPGCESAVDSMLKAPSCKRIAIENVILDNLQLITEKVITSGNTSIEEINLQGCKINHSDFLIQSIVDIASFCLFINFLDISKMKWNVTGNNNSKLIESLCNLKNLRTLYLTPSMLNGETEQEKTSLKLSFRKMAKSCKFLENLQIIELYFQFDGKISQDVLSDIKYLENLQELHLVRFSTLGNEPALAEITRNCTRLTHLYIVDIYDVDLDRCELPWEQILVHAKQLKHLSLNQDFTLTKGIVDILVECTQMEKLCVRPIDNEAVEAKQYFADNLQKLTKLEVFITSDSKQVLENFRSAINEIDETKRPLFCGQFLNDGFVLPLTHWHLLQHLCQ